MLKFLSKLIDSNEKELNKLQPQVEKINSLEPEFEKLTDNQLKAKTAEFKNKIGDLRQRQSEKEALNEILPEVFAAAREAAKRTLGQRHFDVQLMGGIVLHQGKIAEMKTGEGKTLVATLPLYLNALTEKGCHLVTVNDFLSKRDTQWMGPIYDALGLSVGCIQHEKSYLFDRQEKEIKFGEEFNLKPCTRREAYAADITYGTNNEFGFDYLRDNMVYRLEDEAQRGHHFGIVDEVDSILIDEARTPLIISAPAEESARLYEQFAQIVPSLTPEKDYQVDEKMRAATLTDSGIEKVERAIGLKDLYGDPRAVTLAHHLDNALKAYTLFKKDKDYVVKDGEIIIVDEFTGRLMYGRRYSEGLHQAIEAKEGVEIKRESDTLATISFQNYFRMYEKLAGMTGTAATESEEFYKIYGLEVAVIPTNKPLIRTEFPDKIYKNEEAKFRAVAEDIKERQEKGQPVLVGTISIEKNEILSEMLRRQGVPHEVLNAKHHEREAKIIAQAGRLGAVTVATNMAGRGVDIILGGNPPEPGEAGKVIEFGGLHVLGTERHEARRIDNQLRGRSGRQGDPGSSQFYASLEDDLMRIFGGDRVKRLMEMLKLPEDMPIQHSLISKSIESAQKKVEGHNFDLRKHLLEYDDVMNKHRQAIYKRRKGILEKESIRDEVLDFMAEEEQEDYKEKVKKYGEETMRQIEKMVYLRCIDTFWIEHLNAMEELREGIGLRGWGQRDPLVEYKHESYNLYQRLISAIENQVALILTKIEVEEKPKVEEERRPLVLQAPSESLAAGTFSGLRQEQQVTEPKVTEGPTIAERAGVRKETAVAPFPKVGRNDPCPCGAKNPKTGKPLKYKKCHGRFAS